MPNPAETPAWLSVRIGLLETEGVVSFEKA